MKPELIKLLESNFEQNKLPYQTTRIAMIETDTKTLIVSSAAISPKGLVLASVRHDDNLFYNAVDNFKHQPKHYHDWIQGFLTNTYCFVTREEAWIIAERQNQIRNKLPCDDAKRLYSENLY